MQRAAGSIRRVAFPVVVAAALAFGAAQALASPGVAKKAAKSCSDERCDAICVSHGYAGGDCLTGACRCFN
ncbi:MAG TPA: hypothetical protein VF771_03940 [Longimicrobiaceae bacterium]